MPRDIKLLSRADKLKVQKTSKLTSGDVIFPYSDRTPIEDK